MTEPGHPGLERLADVMHAVRRGCPWDAGQSHESPVPYLIAEAAEVVEAVENGDGEHLREDLGDLLLQVFFHCEIAAEHGSFDIDDVAHHVTDKLIPTA